MKDSTRRIYNFLYGTVRGKKPMVTRAPNRYIAEQVGFSVYTVSAALKELEGAGYIKRKTTTTFPTVWQQGDPPVTVRKITCLVDDWVN